MTRPNPRLALSAAAALGIVAVFALCASAASAISAAVPPVSSAGVESARLGAVQAILSYSVVDPGGDRSNGVRVANVRLKILRAEGRGFEKALRCPQGACYLSDYAHRIHVVRLAPGEPHAVVNLWSGGMRCCTITRVHSTTMRSASPIEYVWPNTGAGANPRVRGGIRDADGDGLAEFVTRDGRFPTYASQAELMLPLRVVGLRQGRLRNRTPSFRKLLLADSRELWGWYLAARNRTTTDFWGNPVNGCFNACRGYLGVWAAEQVLLGRWQSAIQPLRHAAQQGELEGEMGGPAGGRAYLGHLQNVLIKLGYLRRSAPRLAP